MTALRTPEKALRTLRDISFRTWSHCCHAVAAVLTSRQFARLLPWQKSVPIHAGNCCGPVITAVLGRLIAAGMVAGLISVDHNSGFLGRFIEVIPPIMARRAVTVAKVSHAPFLEAIVINGLSPNKNKPIWLDHFEKVQIGFFGPLKQTGAGLYSPVGVFGWIRFGHGDIPTPLQFDLGHDLDVLRRNFPYIPNQNQSDTVGLADELIDAHGLYAQIGAVLPRAGLLGVDEGSSCDQPQGDGRKRQQHREYGQSVISAIHIAEEPVPVGAWFWSRIIGGFAAMYFVALAQSSAAKRELGNLWFDVLCVIWFGVIAIFGDVIGGWITNAFAI